MADDLATAIRTSAQRLGIDPSDLATAISYETAGTFDPWKKGPTTQWGEHRGLIQFGEPQRQKYGVTQDMPVGAQMEAAEKYLTDAGVKPGMGLLDIYSAINAGKVGRYNASDANNGGAPGTVAQKVAEQMYGHRLKANALLGLQGPAGAASVQAAAATPQPTAAPASAPFSLAPSADATAAAPALDIGAITKAIAAAQQEEQPKLAPIAHPEQAYINKAKRLARAAAQRGVA